MLNTVKELRGKYQKRNTSDDYPRYPAGGEDIHRLCILCDRLEQIILDLQRRLLADQQNEINRRIWSLDI